MWDAEDEVMVNTLAGVETLADTEPANTQVEEEVKLAWVQAAMAPGAGAKPPCALHAWGRVRNDSRKAAAAIPCTMCEAKRGRGTWFLEVQALREGGVRYLPHAICRGVLGGRGAGRYHRCRKEMRALKLR